MDIQTLIDTANQQTDAVIWLLALVNKTNYPSLDEARKALAANDWLTSLQAGLTQTKVELETQKIVLESAVVAPAVPTPPIDLTPSTGTP